jgi:hypothetical protein
MIANITSTPADRPDTTSTHIARICEASTRPIRPALRSSTSCQTNRYGEIVVPKMTSASTDASVGVEAGEPGIGDPGAAVPRPDPASPRSSVAAWRDAERRPSSFPQTHRGGTARAGTEPPQWR